MRRRSSPTTVQHCPILATTVYYLLLSHFCPLVSTTGQYCPLLVTSEPNLSSPLLSTAGFYWLFNHYCPVSSPVQHCPPLATSVHYCSLLAPHPLLSSGQCPLLSSTVHYCLLLATWQLLSTSVHYWLLHNQTSAVQCPVSTTVHFCPSLSTAVHY